MVVRGRVQGVWFRGSTRERALELGVRGWVRNCADGSVEAVFEGAPGAVSEAVEYVRRGPAGARVANVATHDESPTGEETGFEIRR